MGTDTPPLVRSPGDVHRETLWRALARVGYPLASDATNIDDKHRDCFDAVSERKVHSWWATKRCRERSEEPDRDVDRDGRWTRMDGEVQPCFEYSGGPQWEHTKRT